MKTSFIKLFLTGQGHSLKEAFLIVYITLRRKLYFKFKKDYVLDMVKKRKGRCNQGQCGQDQSNRYNCCNLWFCKAPCEYLDGKNCLIHDQPDKPPRPNCHLYPFDEKDKIPFYKDHCGFYWDDEK